jgi:hypothetical protein
MLSRPRKRAQTPPSDPTPERPCYTRVAIARWSNISEKAMSRQRKPVERPSAAGLTAALAIAGVLTAMLVLMILMDPARP